MPFGLDLKTVIVTMLIMLFVYPWLVAKFHGMGSKNASA